jgi:hypothetical protein
MASFTDYTPVKGDGGYRIHWKSLHDAGHIPHSPSPTREGAMEEAVRYLHLHLEEIHDILHDLSGINGSAD